MTFKPYHVENGTRTSRFSSEVQDSTYRSAVMKVAVVGTNGLAQYIANCLATETSHQFVILSRTVDYSSQADLQFKLAGVDTVISTISGNPQLALIDAAAAVHVRRFVPSEFCGPPPSLYMPSPSPSPPPHGLPVDNERHAAALQRLSQLESQPNGMTFTVFTCGIFYERFAPGGLAASQIGLTNNNDIAHEGAYLMDFRRRTAQIPFAVDVTATGGGGGPGPATICMTAARDVARFVIAALELPVWPREFRFCGERMTVREVVAIAESIQGRPFEISGHTISSLHDALTYARAVGDRGREIRIQQLIATAEGRYDFADMNLHPPLVPVWPERFRDWLARVWSSQGPRT
ncbi:hypothetical protein HRR78_001116 [Exophiala dermatitidis]|nr:hypothetical protein HRR75_002580 [Exophiala dermatitidis]KAJ4557446.1 hypothetical protein HRR78_001116 [Exophiala dermatitidis]